MKKAGSIEPAFFYASTYLPRPFFTHPGRRLIQTLQKI